MLPKNKNITIAVLPFHITSHDERVTQLFLGFVEDLITHFSKFIGLSVISSYSTHRIKEIANPEEILKLGADFLIYGSVRYHKDNLRISIQLVKTEDHSLVFGNQYHETIDSLLETQDDIIQQIVAVLEEKINYNLLSHSYKKSSVELAAYENYLMGMHTLQKGTGDHDLKARAYFNAALKIDPNYSLAYTGLSLSYFNFWSCLIWNRWDESMQGAHKYALKAIGLDPNDYTALGVLGRTYVYLGEYEKAEHYLRKSLRMNSNDCSHLLRVAFSLMYLGFADDALKWYLKALDLNPFHNDHYYAHGSIYYLAIGDFKSCIALSKKTNFNSWTDFPAYIAAAYLQLKEYDDVWRCWKVYLSQFQQAVYSGQKPMEEEALAWLVMVNPFKGFTYLTPLVEFIRTEKQLHEQTDDSPVESTINNTFQSKGDYWDMCYQGHCITLKHAKGFKDIHKLLNHPKQEFHCLDLMNAAVDERSSAKTMDQKAKLAYQRRIKELQEEIDEAEDLNQIEKLAPLKAEYDAILTHLSQSLGLSGKTRTSGSTIEKARSAVTWRIRSSIKKIAKIHPSLGNHLSNAIKTGSFCSYTPEVDVDWTL
ncbi:tetratricopeptide repeat protein [Aestuariivivens sediminis]|uniref:tetratricopeptide repeat protein n=1 Tax=Aestuariivivens sediminis TaxID=2913557 RepID=UPI001F5A53F5|nr:hypothetical protein [Aestuariivivens sediminis]